MYHNLNVNRTLLLSSKTYIVIAITSLVLLFYSILQIKPVVVDIKDFLGLTSHLTLVYWIGYVLIIFCSVILYLDEGSKNDVAYIIILIVFGLFIFGVPIFAEENARFPWSYYPTGEIKNVLKDYHIDSTQSYPLLSYRNWPSIHFITAYVMQISNIELEKLLKYMPIYWVILFIFLCFTAGRFLNLSKNQSFILSFMALSSYWLFQYYYGPQPIAFLQYLGIFVALLRFRNEFEYRLPILIFFGALVTTHLLTSLMILIILSILSIINKKRFKTFFILFIVIFLVWNIYLAPTMLEVGVKDFVKQFEDKDFFYYKIINEQSPSSELKYTVSGLHRYYIMIYAICFIVSMLYYIKNRKILNIDDRQKIIFCLAWIVPLIFLNIFKYGAEMYERVYMLSMIPIISIIAILFHDKKIFVILAIILAIAIIPAKFGDESVTMTYTTELAGTKFFANNIDNDHVYFYSFSPYVKYYNPDKVLEPSRTFSYLKDADISVLDNVEYILDGKQNMNYMFYVFSFDPIVRWKDSGKKFDMTYNNGDFKIIKNILNEKIEIWKPKW